MTKTIQSLAKQLYSHTETKIRDSGEEFITLSEDAPDWAIDIVRAAHGEFLPDDWRYNFIAESCQTIIEYEDDLDSGRESLQPDVYNGELLKWLSSNLLRPSYVDEAVSEYSVTTKDFSIMQVIAWGQLKEKEEVFTQLFLALEQLAENNGSENCPIAVGE